VRRRGGVPERPKGRDCKSRGFSLRGFESHPLQHGQEKLLKMFCLVTVRLEPYLTMCGVAGWPSAGLIPQEYPGSNPGAVPVGAGVIYLVEMFDI
jgi:hypothetical protein